MSKFQEKIQNAVKALANNMVDKETREWPPACLLLTYQPKRPDSQTNASVAEETVAEKA